MNKDEIKEINELCPYGQGIFIQPNGIPVDIKEPVIYSSYVNRGLTGGGWDSSDLRPFTEEMPSDHMEVLDIVLGKICPEITYLQFKKISKLIHSKERDGIADYYGNYDNHTIEYILLSELENFLKSLCVKE